MSTSPLGRSVKGQPPATHLVKEWLNWSRPDSLGGSFACGGAAFHVAPVTADEADNLCDRCLLADLGPVVYRFYDADGALIYIGSSGNLLGRLEAHRATTPWWCEVRDYSLEFHPDLVSARVAEKRAIFAEYPLYNVRDKAPDAPRVVYTPALDGAA